MATAAAVALPPTKSESLWLAALETLKKKDLALLRPLRSSKIDVLEHVARLTEQKQAECLQRRWVIHHRGREIVLRDLFSRIALWVRKFKEVGDVVAQYDPSHAALPWAAVRVILEVTTSDVELFATVAAGLDTVTNIISRYAIFEVLYQAEGGRIEQLMDAALTKLYATVLRFLAWCIKYYAQSTLLRMFKSIAHAAERRLEEFLGEINTQQNELDSLSRLVDAGVSRDVREHLEEVLKTLNDSVEERERKDVLDWVSTIPSYEKHIVLSKALVAGTGTWLLKHDSSFKEWLTRPNGGIFALKGDPGVGKTHLTAAVVRDLKAHARSTANSTVAFFYCDATQKLLSDPVQVLRSLVRQVSSSQVASIVDLFNKKKAALARHGFEKRMPESPDIDEAADLLADAASSRKLFLVIDAMDECVAEDRASLMHSLKRLVTSCKHPVKIFITSRYDRDVDAILQATYTVHVTEAVNRKDIEEYVSSEVSSSIHREEILHGNVNNDLRQHISQALTDGSKGMFLWAALQLRALKNPRRMKTEHDVRHALSKSPKSLNDLYARIFSQIDEQEEHSRQLTRKLLAWVAFAERPLSVSELIAAVSEDAQQPELSGLEEVLDLGCNMLGVQPVLAKRSKQVDSELWALEVRYVHLSAQEYAAGMLDRKLFHETAVHRCFAELQGVQFSNDGPQNLRGEFEALLLCDNGYLDEHDPGANGSVNGAPNIAEQTSSVIRSLPPGVAARNDQDVQLIRSKVQNETPFRFYAASHWPMHYYESSSKIRPIAKTKELQDLFFNSKSSTTNKFREYIAWRRVQNYKPGQPPPFTDIGEMFDTDWMFWAVRLFYSLLAMIPPLLMLLTFLPDAVIHLAISYPPITGALVVLGVYVPVVWKLAWNMMVYLAISMASCIKFAVWLFNFACGDTIISVGTAKA